jgi:hypothetical protein
VGGFKGLCMQKIIEIKRETKGDSVALGMFWIGVLLMFLLFLQGCFPLLTGIKKHTHSDGSVTEFITGADFTIGANGLDTVDNNRGINPEKYTKQ